MDKIGGKTMQQNLNLILSLKKISRKFKDGDKELLVLDNLELKIFESDLISIMGKSGSGKTTLLNIIALLDQDYTGELIYDGKLVRNLNSKQIFNLRKSSIGYIFQNHNLIGELNVLENVEMPLGYLGTEKKERRKTSLKFLKEVGLEGKENQKIHELSGGEQQRVSIARALTTSPKILIADEPTGNLDASTSDSIIALMKDLNSKLKTAIILVTHDRDVAQMCTRKFNLLGGKIYVKQ